MPSRTTCPGCGESLSGYVDKCPNCGEHLHAHSHQATAEDVAVTQALLREERDGSSEELPCRSCGRLLSSYVTKCPHCGTHTHRHSHEHDANVEIAKEKFLPRLIGVTLFVVISAVLVYISLTYRLDAERAKERQKEQLEEEMGDTESAWIEPEDRSE